AIAAYELVNRYMKSGQSKEDTANQIFGSNKEDSGHSHLSDRIHTVAKYVAVGALGLVAGGFVARHMSRAAEFAADKRAVQFTKDPKALISALTKLEESAAAAIASTTKEA